jgi:hypothetical protein
LKKHLNSISNFIPYFKTYSLLAKHFNLKGHNINIHFSFFIFKKDLEYSKRLDLESQIIHLFINSGTSILNTEIPKLKNTLNNIF